MPFDVVRPQTITVQGDTLRSYEIDLAGTGGTLANGTVTIGGKSWTVGGVGSSNLVYLETDLANFFADYDGSIHDVELTGNVTSATLGDTAGVFGFIRLDSTNTYGQFMINYMVGGSTFQQGGTNVAGSYAVTTTGVTTLATYYKEWALSANGNLMQGTIGNDTAIAPFRLAKNADKYFYTIAQGTRPQTQRFGTGDKIRVYSEAYSGAGRVTSVVQSASGITINLGAQAITWRKLYLFLGTPEVS